MTHGIGGGRSRLGVTTRSMVENERRSDWTGVIDGLFVGHSGASLVFPWQQPIAPAPLRGVTGDRLICWMALWSRRAGK